MRALRGVAGTEHEAATERVRVVQDKRTLAALIARWQCQESAVIWGHHFLPRSVQCDSPAGVPGFSRCRGGLHRGVSAWRGWRLENAAGIARQFGDVSEHGAAQGNHEGGHAAQPMALRGLGLAVPMTTRRRSRRAGVSGGALSTTARTTSGSITRPGRTRGQPRRGRHEQPAGRSGGR